MEEAMYVDWLSVAAELLPLVGLDGILGLLETGTGAFPIGLDGTDLPACPQMVVDLVGDAGIRGRQHVVKLGLTHACAGSELFCDGPQGVHLCA